MAINTVLSPLRRQCKLNEMEKIDGQIKNVRKRFEREQPLVSSVLPDGTLVEMLFQPDQQKTLFCVAKNGEWRLESRLSIRGTTMVPYSPGNNLLQNGVVLLPSLPVEYGSDEDLVGEIRTLIHRYVDVSPLFEQVASYYVLLSWVYDSFGELPYLRLRGDPGCGKTRFLLVVGSLCYKPIFASGASTVSPLFRILDAFRGTLIIDEGDFRFSDESAEIVKILNNGNARGFPVLRSEYAMHQREFNPRAYAVFGPKLVATRKFFQDRALESRCLTEEMGQFALREDVPINLPACCPEEALALRNKLLLFRIRNRNRVRALESMVDRAIEPRLNQVFAPLLSIVSDERVRSELRQLARKVNADLIADLGTEMEAQVLEIIRDLLRSEGKASVKAVTSWFVDRFGEEYDAKITAKWIGSLIRKKLHLRTQKSNGVYIIPPTEHDKLKTLYNRYGLEVVEAKDSVATFGGRDDVDFGDVLNTNEPKTSEPEIPIQNST